MVFLYNLDTKSRERIRINQLNRFHFIKSVRWFSVSVINQIEMFLFYLFTSRDEDILLIIVKSSHPKNELFVVFYSYIDRKSSVLFESSLFFNAPGFFRLYVGKPFCAKVEKCINAYP